MPSGLIYNMHRINTISYERSPVCSMIHVPLIIKYSIQFSFSYFRLLQFGKSKMYNAPFINKRLTEKWRWWMIIFVISCGMPLLIHAINSKAI